MAVGVLLMSLGLGGYYYTDRESATALIPAALGVVLVVLGVLARNDKMRKHAMHAAMLFALIGCTASTWRAIKAFTTEPNPDKVPRPAVPYIHLAIVVVCAVFIALGIKSFVDARRRRRLGDMK
jgi:uncharacterized membrane protein